MEKGVVRSEVFDLVPKLSEAPQPADALPAAIREAFGRSSGVIPEPAMYPALSRRSLSVGEDSVYLIPSASGVCVAYVTARDAATHNCASVEQLQDGEPLYAEVEVDCAGDPEVGVRCGRRIIYGVAPKGSASVRAWTDDGRVVTGSVARNAYSIVLSPDVQAERIELVGSG